MSYSRYGSMSYSKYGPSSNRDSKGQSEGGANKMAGGPGTVAKEKEQGAVQKIYPNLEEQGAKPKLYPDLQKAGLKVTTSAPVLNDKVEECWHPLMLYIYLNGLTSTPCKVECSEDIHHAKLLFAFTRRLDETKKILRSKYDIELEIYGKELKFIYPTDPRKQIQFSVENFRHLLREEILDDLESSDIPMHSDILRKVLNKPEKDLPSALLVNRAAFYKCESLNLYHLVSEKGSYEKVKKELGLQSEEVKPAVFPRMLQQSETRQVRLNTLDYRTLEYLGFAGYFQGKHSEMEVEIADGTCLLQLKKGVQTGIKILSQTDFEKEIEEFLRDVSKEEIYFKNEICYKLLYEANSNEPNENVYAFMMKRKKTKKFHIFETNGRHFVYCMKKDEAEEAKEAVEKSIHFHAFVTSSSAIQNFLKSESEHKKLIYETQLNGTISVACTSDLTDNLQKLLTITAKDEYENITMQRYEIEFLKKFGADEVANCKEDHAVQVDFIGDTTIKLGGRVENFPACMQRLKRFIESSRDEVALDISKECLESNCSKMDNTVKENNCFLHVEGDGGKGILTDCSLVAAWMGPLEKLKVSVVTGCSTSMFVDLRVILTNHSLYPVGAVDLSPDVWDDYIGLIGQKFKNDHENKKSVGDIFPFEKPDGLRCEKAVALVVAVNFQNDPISKNLLLQKLIEILKILDTENYRSAGIDVSGIGSAFVSVVKATAYAAFSHVQNHHKKKVVEVYICSSKSDTEELCHTVDNIFKSKGGCSRKLMTAVAGLHNTDVDIRVVVEKGSLPDTNAEVLVNTTNRKLKLNEGQVSRMILKLAGSEIQAELDRKYSNGISYGDVAVTGSYKISGKEKNVEYIFHSALKDYNIENFSKQIKVFVKKCLFQAERLKCRTIAFPALGVGNLVYPRRETAAEIFDAVDEFCKEAIEPCLKKVIIVVYSEDWNTCAAFQSEEWRRSKQYGRDVGEERPEPSKDFRALQKQKGLGELSSLQVTTKEDFKTPKSYAVVLNFDTKGSSQTETPLKRANENPKSWNDEITIIVPKNANERQFKSTLQKYLKKLDEDRTTEIVIYTTKDVHMAEGMQVVKISETLTAPKWEFIRNALIVVTDDSAFQNVQTHINIDSKSWKLSSPTQTKEVVTVKLLGPDGESRGKAKEELLHLVHSIQEKKRKSMVASNYERNRTDNMKGQAENEEDREVFPSMDMENIQDNEGTMEAGDVSAEINPGIIKFKQCQKDLEPWMMQMKMQFKVQIIVENSGAAKVIGDFDRILKFEQYLEDELFVDPENIQFDDEYYSLTPEECKENVNVKTYALGHYVVKVYRSDIKKVHVDCIVVSSNAKLHSIRGVGKAVGDAAGDAAKRDREKLLKGGSLKAKECCLGCPGDLKHTKAIAYVCLPIFSQNRKPVEVLEDFQDAVLNCFYAVDNEEHKTLALPCIGSDANPKHFPFELCAQQYVRALANFKPSNVTEIHFVDINEKNLDMLITEFDKYWPVQSATMEHNEPNPSLFYKLTKVFHGSQHDTQSVNGVQIPGTQIRLFVTSRAISAIKADGIVCTVNEEFKDDSGVLPYISQKNLNSFTEEQLKRLSPGQVLLTENVGVNQMFQYIFYAVSHTDQNQSQETTFTLLENIFRRMPDRLEKIVIPALHIGKAGPNQCMTFVELLIQKCHMTKTGLKEIHIVCKNERDVTEIWEHIRNKCKPCSRMPKPGFALRVSNV